MPFKPHPTEPDKMVYESRKYDFDPIEWRQHASAYEQGFIDGMQKQMQSSVDKAVNSMGKRGWVGLTDEDMNNALDYWSDDSRSSYGGAHAANGEYVDMIETWRYIEAKLKEKNT
jgi:hypothetical protein